MSGATETFDITCSDGELFAVTFRRRGVREILHCVDRFEHADDSTRMEEPGWFEGNRRARRKAAAQARKGVVAKPAAPVTVDDIRALFAAAEAKVNRNKLLADHVVHLQRHREWQAVQALHGVIIDTATPEERAAREAAVNEEWQRIEEAEMAAGGSLE